MKGHALEFVLLFGILFYLSTLLATGRVLAADTTQTRGTVDLVKVSGTADKTAAICERRLNSND